VMEQARVRRELALWVLGGSGRGVVARGERM
jgi:hypothetical protein